MEARTEASRAAGLDRLASFVALSLSHYPNARNFDFGPGRRSNVSLLSPYIRHRLILEHEVLNETLQRHSLATASKFVQEVFWRGYFKGWLEHRPDVWRDYRASVVTLIKQLESDADLLRRYTAATSGETGIHCFDAWIRELRQYGYLHNHARMWFASIWIFTLRLPWQLGADFFYRQLIDGDPASNTLSWRWVAGLHTKGKTYLALSANIARYTDNRFDPKGQLALDAPALTESCVFPIRNLPSPDSLSGARDYGLVITEEDACPETLGVEQGPRSILGVVATSRRSPLPVGEAAQDFASKAVTDALRRATQHFAVDGQFARTEDWNNLLKEWALNQGLKTIVTAYAPVGPVAELLATAQGQLQDQGIRLLQIRRPFDSATWPHAKRGYFKLKEKIPMLLETLGIETVAELPGAHSEAV